MNYLKTKELADAIIVSPDAGRAKLAEKYAGVLKLPIAYMHKRRSGIGGRDVEVLEIIGDVCDKTPVIIDDVIAGGSIIQQARALYKTGANAAYIAVTHGVLVGQSLERLNEECIREVIITNTVPVPDDKRILIPKLQVLSIAPLLATVIRNIHNNKSVSQVFLAQHLEFAI